MEIKLDKQLILKLVKQETKQLKELVSVSNTVEWISFERNVSKNLSGKSLRCELMQQTCILTFSGQPL